MNTTKNDLNELILQQLPLGMQNFEQIRKTGHLYVDKTMYIHRMATRGKAYFISRPRRFGKSLLISTLQALFEGKRELFDGLAVNHLKYDWKVYPVLRLVIPELNEQEGYADLVRKIQDELIFAGKRLGVIIDRQDHVDSMFKALIARITEGGEQLVVLIDEYDKPIVSVIHDPQRLSAIRSLLKSFYGILKDSDDSLRFLLLTGVSEFAQMSIFSGLNHLTKLTFLNDYGTLLGYTDTEIDHYFTTYLEIMAADLDRSVDDIRQQFRRMYNGYQFCDKGPRVYNPYSVMLALESRRFGYHWYKTGTPSFLVKLISQQTVDFFGIEGISHTEQELGQLLVCADGYLENLRHEDQVGITALLYQTGYWTIDRYDVQSQSYFLKVSNEEVREGLTEMLVCKELYSQGELVELVSRAG